MNFNVVLNRLNPKIMFVSMTYRNLLSASSACMRLPVRYINKAVPIVSNKNATNQMDYLRSIMDNKIEDWSAVKSTILNIKGSVNQKNFDAVLLKVLISNQKIDAALSFAEYMKRSQELNIGSINGLLGLYYEIGKENKLSNEEKSFILQSYQSLYDKYKVLDSTTCERLLHALCVIDEWKKALKVLNDIQVSCNPTHSAYSTLIATFFKLNKKNEAMKLIETSIINRRPLQHKAYEEWINYILRKYKDKKTIVKYLEEIFCHINKNAAPITKTTAEKIIETFVSLGWNAQYTKIRKQNGQCLCCKDSLDCLKITDEEFTLLQQNVKDKLIVGSDLFLKTSPDEIKRFFEFIENSAPYDIVLDALNISFAASKGLSMDRMGLLTAVVDNFREQNKKILLLGRKHMMRWPRMNQLMRKTSTFFTEDQSQDDPYFITAAILSGSHTDIVSKDLLRGHRFLMKDEQLRFIFQRWQWQHQWMVFANRNGQPVIQPPLSVTPCAQKKNSSWHIPFEREDASTALAGQVKDGTPDWSSWLCVRPPVAR